MSSRLFMKSSAKKEMWGAGNLSFQPTELSNWETVWGWLLPLPFGNGKKHIESQDKEWAAKFICYISIPAGVLPLVCMRHILVHVYLLVFRECIKLIYNAFQRL